MTKGIRIVLGLLILILSCALFLWGLLPSRRVIRSQPISPTELQLPIPTPASFQIPSTEERMVFVCVRPPL